MYMSKKSMMPKSPELKLHPKLPPTTHPENRHGFAFFAARWKSCRRLTATKEASGCLRLRSSSRGVNGSEGGKLRGQMPHFRKARCGLFQKILGSTPLKKRSFKLRVFMSELWYSFFLYMSIVLIMVMHDDDTDTYRFVWSLAAVST